ncbi:EAL domain-containing protein [Pseudomonas sp. 7P_10.2_Bac1]|uniref:putative bifunctional diguanylate cyclase/phosphodiesterase n=1 Tax=Pseudomonas sp. 7P_10.2_Bac1 TaxID=2971614 RepID=UPI0021C7D9FE|nr:EAL domain-containing protein [Pseudomonas sp. 7P_10.2_Bac1]MCU1728875.1 EAL domain-containing protein [Pseudomonas sp. 7P_10.2_Bac1]
MDWFEWQFLGKHVEHSQQILHSSHNLYLVLIAWLVACAASLATLQMVERACNAEKTTAKTLWRWLGASCLAGGIWAMHFISMLAFESSIEVHYNLVITIGSLLIMWVSALLAMYLLNQPSLSRARMMLAALIFGLGIGGMHYSGMSAMHTYSHQQYDPIGVALSLVLAVGGSYWALLMAIALRSTQGVVHQLFKYAISCTAGTAILSVHFIGMWALHSFSPLDAGSQAYIETNHWQLALMVAVITLLLIGSSISAALVDKKLQQKEQDLARVNALLSQLDEARMFLQQVAHYDPLTNLINRRGFNQIFAEKLADATANNNKLAVLFLDIDHFKRINDSLGHDAGDELLQNIASLIRGTARGHEDVVARFGGDEFCILIDIHQRDEAQNMAKRIMHTLKDPIELAGRRMVMTTSIGISVFPDDGTTPTELLKQADLALYQSKGNGRNSLNFFSRNLTTRASLELQIEEELRHALTEDTGLVLYYQPIVDLKHGRVAKLEALVRWEHPEHGLLCPDRFINIAETNGLIAQLDHWVLRKACTDLATLSRLGWQQLGIAVNCSALNLVREELADEIESALYTSDIAPHRLELEVTENALMGNISNTSQLLRQIRALGVSLSIDDFGTGYSSLAYLKRLPLNTLKIDRSFIQDIQTSSQDMEIVQAIIVMAHTLQLQVVTEGVETTEQLELLRHYGCDFIQGYLISRPVELDALPRVLEQLNTSHRFTSSYSALQIQ